MSDEECGYHLIYSFNGWPSTSISRENFFPHQSRINQANMRWSMLRKGIQPFTKQNFSTIRPQINKLGQNSSPLKTRLSSQFIGLQSRFRQSSSRFFSSSNRPQFNLDTLRFLKTQISKPFYIITAINTAVYLVWTYADIRRENGDSSWLNFMQTHFTLNSVSPLPWTFITSLFSHNSIFHLIVNTFVLYSFMPAIVSLIGQRVVYPFYLGAGIVAGLGEMLYKK
jgi:hypothetical protein